MVYKNVTIRFPTADKKGKHQKIRIYSKILTIYVTDTAVKICASTPAEFLDANEILTPTVSFNYTSKHYLCYFFFKSFDYAAMILRGKSNVSRVKNRYKTIDMPQDNDVFSLHSTTYKRLRKRTQSHV
jgi:hypothetical protein